MNGVAVVYLSRGVDGGVDAARRFLRACADLPAGVAHRLVAAVKGYADAGARAEVEDLVRAHGGETLALPDDGFDLGAYFRAAATVDAEWICLLNTHSEPLVPDWLRMLRDAAAAPGVGAAGATGSFGAMAPTLALYPPMLRRMRRDMPLPLFALRAFASVAVFYPVKRLIWRGWPSFPNPNLRTNAVVMRTAHLREFGAAKGIPRSKAECWAIESGRDSLTRWLERKGLASVVVDRHGRAHAPAGWEPSGTFRTPGQPNLIIADNQTRRYADAGLDERQVMEISAWGRALSQ